MKRPLETVAFLFAVKAPVPDTSPHLGGWSGTDAPP
jgi:hypothetical protein